MSSALVPPPLTCTSRSRCPSPVVPGAWPQSTTTTPTHLRHERSGTYPPPSKLGSVPPAAPVHVTSFQQRLFQSLPKPSGSTSSGLLPDASSASTGVFMQGHSISESTLSKNDSDLTEFVLHDTSNSCSQSANTSISTAYTAESVAPEGHASKTTLELPFILPLDNEERIYSHKSLPVTPTRLPHATHDDSTLSSIHSSLAGLGTNIGALCIERSGVIVPCDIAPAVPPTPGSPRSAASVPTSPIVFASPTSSKIMRPAWHSRSLLQDTSNSACESLITSSPSSGERAWLDVVERNDLSTSPSETLMVDGFDGMNILTTLSSPSRLCSTGGLENEAGVLDRSWMQSHSSQSLLSPISVHSTSVQREDNEQEAGSMASPLPESVSMLMPSSPTLTSPLPSPNSDLSSLHASFAARLDGFDENPEPTGATEYAEAVMSFAWGSSSVYQAMDVGDTIGLSLIAIENDPTEDHVPGEDPCRGGPPLEYSSKGTSTRKSVVEKILRFGGKIKRMWRRSGDKRWKDLAIVRDLGRRSTRLTVSVDVNTNADTSAATQARIFTDTSSPRSSQDPNVRLRSRKPRPSLNEHTYSPTAPPDHISLSEGNGISLSARRHSTKTQLQDIKGKAKASASESPTDSEHQRKAIPHRLSITSTTTNTGHSADTQPTLRARPLSSIISMNRHIPVMNSPRRTYCGPVNVKIEGLNPDGSVVQTNAGVERPQEGGPPGLPSTTSSEVGNSELQRHGVSDNHINIPQNPSRRFSLSALSNLIIWKDISASGARKRGSWMSIRPRA